MRAIIEGYVITVQKPNSNKQNDRGGFEFLTLGDGAYQRSKIIRIAGDGVKASMSEKVRIEIIEQEYVDKKTGELKVFWRKTDAPVQVVK